jgi:regulator of replication initiation timing
MVTENLTLRDERAALSSKIVQLNQDIARMQKNTAEIVKENEKLKVELKRYVDTERNFSAAALAGK